MSEEEKKEVKADFIDVVVGPGETLQEVVERELKAKFPDLEIKYAADEADVPSEALETLKAYDEMCHSSREDGTCVDCGAQMPNWPPPENTDEDWEPPEEWGIFVSEDDSEIVAFQCPECMEKSQKL